MWDTGTATVLRNRTAVERLVFSQTGRLFTIELATADRSYIDAMRVRGAWRGVFVVVFALVGCTGEAAPGIDAVATSTGVPEAAVSIGPAATASGDPVATVTGFIAGLKGSNFDQLPALFCPTYQDAIRTWDGTDLIRAQLPEISLAQAHDAVDVIANLFVSKSQVFGTTAQAHLTGNITSAGAAYLSECTSVDDDLLPTFANGTWLICGDTNHFTHG